MEKTFRMRRTLLAVRPDVLAGCALNATGSKAATFGAKNLRPDIIDAIIARTAPALGQATNLTLRMKRSLGGGQRRA